MNKPLHTVGLIITLLVLYGVFQLVIGQMIISEIRRIDAQLANLSQNQDGNREPLSVSSSSCSLLVEHDNWRGALDKWFFPWAEKEANRLRAHHLFYLVPNRPDQTHCMKGINFIIIDSEKNRT